MKKEDKALKRISELVEDQLIGVLGTCNKGVPYSCLVSFVNSDDLSKFYFATMSERKKYRNMIANNQIALHIDNRRNLPDDIHGASSLAIVGSISTCIGEEREKYSNKITQRHSNLRGFVQHPDCEIIRVDVSEMYLVEEFERTVRLTF